MIWSSSPLLFVPCMARGFGYLFMFKCSRMGTMVLYPPRSPAPSAILIRYVLLEHCISRTCKWTVNAPSLQGSLLLKYSYSDTIVKPFSEPGLISLLSWVARSPSEHYKHISKASPYHVDASNGQVIKHTALQTLQIVGRLERTYVSSEPSTNPQTSFHIPIFH